MIGLRLPGGATGALSDGFHSLAFGFRVMVGCAGIVEVRPEEPTEPGEDGTEASSLKDAPSSAGAARGGIPILPEVGVVDSGSAEVLCAEAMLLVRSRASAVV